MAKVTAESLKPNHVKAARELLGWDQVDLASRCSVSERTIKHFEAGHSVRDSSRAAILAALVEAGVRLDSSPRRFVLAIHASEENPEWVLPRTKSS